jgi:hypothetical protein
MTEPVTEPTPPEMVHEARDQSAERALARTNMVWGWALFGLFLVLFGGTVGIALVYLWLS